MERGGRWVAAHNGGLNIKSQVGGKADPAGTPAGRDGPIHRFSLALAV
jgi:hypothetical protein